ncbi:lytic transglycosylase [Skermania sp. ID1734]|uniref:lytic transglycosylase domain-containing protein n=1 Tax=Skermania sp. ID1734 TaxID=2597516 RepID=UPI00117D3E67|nr:lytic murein transglycosylase [Skermania sp. ID1734]TSE01902.1 lytic transglycosylase [Skermania sp. ID1734]
MRLRAPITMSAIVLAGLVTAGSSAITLKGPDPRTPAPLLSAAALEQQQSATVQLATHVGIVPAAPRQAYKMRAADPMMPSAAFAAGTPIKEVAIPGVLGALGIPEIALAAYRNAELAMAQSDPGCGLSWSLLAGIGRIESGHAGDGRTDAAGTTITPILGPSLDGHLPGNEVIRTAGGEYVRAIGPMQFLPSTWAHYASDGNGDGIADPNNVFDASLAAAKYLCSGGLNLRDPAQELRAVLRYNNSMSYAANVLTWAAAYQAGGTPTTVPVSPNLIPPSDSVALAAGPADPAAAAAALAASGAASSTTTTTTTTTTAPPTTTQQMITIPGLPPIPCGIFCPPPPPPPPTPAAPAEPAKTTPTGGAEQKAPAADPEHKAPAPVQPAATTTAPAPAPPSIQIGGFKLVIPGQPG